MEPPYAAAVRGSGLRRHGIISDDLPFKPPAGIMHKQRWRNALDSALIQAPTSANLDITRTVRNLSLATTNFKMNIVTDTQTKADDLEDTYPLSPLQHGMLMHSLLEPGSGIDVEQLIFELCETLDLPKLQQATKCLTDRHPILRTSFRWENLEAPRQEVHRLIQLPFEQHDWRSIPEGEHNRRFADFLKADRRRGFDLAHPPLWRLTIVRYDATKWRLIWTQHHSILDGRAFALLLWELFTFYDALVRGEKITLPMPRPYRDYISWLQLQSFGKASHFGVVL